MFSLFSFSVLVCGGAALVTMRGRSDRWKIERIFMNSGLMIKEKRGEQTYIKKCKLHRKSKFDQYVEYVYRIPLGLSFNDFDKSMHKIQDGLNNKKNGLQKEIEMDYDGMLRIRVFDTPMLDMVPYEPITKNWMIPIGVSRTEVIKHDFEKIPHLVVAGTTRYGKTVFLKMAITTLIMNKPDQTELLLIDLKGGLAFNRFSKLRQVKSVASNTIDALESLQVIEGAIKSRIQIFKQKGYEDITEAESIGMKLPRVFIIVDEAAELSSQGIKDKEEKKVRAACEKILSYIARVAGGVGYRIIYCTQYPTADTLPRQIKQNADAKLCFRLQTQRASEVVLDEGGAEDLPYIRGRAIYQTDRKYIVQVPYMSNDYIAEQLAIHERSPNQNDDEQSREKQNTNRTNLIKFG
ncbi:cell division protein FtsK [Bacillus sp. TS-2]|nr:cell division protein FtsK [Bacillus sp. TS-2]